MVTPFPVMMLPRKRKQINAQVIDVKRGEFPTCDCDRLFAQDIMVHCTKHRQYVPCAYKIGCYDIALDQEFTRIVPNQWPEECPHAREMSTVREGTLGYPAGMSVLTVGDGDFSFSLALARILLKGKKSSRKRLIATSYESRTTLEGVYPNLLDTLAKLEGCGAQVAYQVDATWLTEMLPGCFPNAGKTLRFHWIIWNFPCTAIGHGQDGQNDAMEENKELVRRFASNAGHLLHPDGKIHMLHKMKPPYNHWRLEEVALQGYTGDSIIIFYGRVVLDRFTLCPYTPWKALDRKSFPCHDACIFVLEWNQSWVITMKARYHFQCLFPPSQTFLTIIQFLSGRTEI